MIIWNLEDNFFPERYYLNNSPLSQRENLSLQTAMSSNF